VSSGGRFGLTPSAWGLAIIGGVAIGVAYVLSPLTVWFIAAMVLVVAFSRSGLEGTERRWLTAVLVVAIVARVAAVAALFLVTDHNSVPFGHFFGDEEYFVKRSIWLRNVALGIPVHGADLIYAFDEYSQTSYLYVLAFIQILVGPSPYGVHLIGIGCYLAAAVLLFKVVRPALGRTPALIGLVVVLFLPSQFAWSVSALKDPMFFLLTVVTLAMAIELVRGRTWRRRAIALLTIVAIAITLETFRKAGMVLTIASIAAGLTIAALVLRPRLLLVLVMVTPIVLGLTLRRPAVQLKVYQAVQTAAKQHFGHVATAGYVYKLLDERLYDDRGFIDDMHFDEAARFIVRALERYVTVPLPWEARSAAALAYVPEQLVWYVIVAFAPIGLVFSFRRDTLVASLLLGYALVAAVTVAVTSGNVGTLVRHRGLALPFMVSLSAVGACELIAWLRHRRENRPATDAGSGTVLMRVEPTWR
jgi:hypothetical protein